MLYNNLWYVDMSDKFSLHPRDCICTLLVLLKNIKTWFTAALGLNVVVTVAIAHQLYQVQKKKNHSLHLDAMIWCEFIPQLSSTVQSSLIYVS